MRGDNYGGRFGSAGSSQWLKACLSLKAEDIAVSDTIQSGDISPMPQRPPTRPRAKSPEKRKDDLMNAAQRLFLENGPAATTIEQIASAADVAKGTFYVYFASKEDVLAALSDRFVIQYVDMLRATISKSPSRDWKGKIAAWAKSGVTGLLDAGPLAEILFHAHQQPVDWNRHNAMAAPLEELLRAGSSDGAWSIGDPHFTATFLFSGLHGVVDDALFGATPINRNELVRRVRVLALRVVALDEE
ncbi:TetR/AcrR family transcriptional regulator [Mesorhizobium sp.]|uniref:TetR/AcrR family transcriptional regulator n=1 Tax=Mesorhizobium sp. TaxID=1871066 RepID=UPI0025DC3E71|nr:TetR/AcrR family transcriptional regulator [Mesorhizobium sp.]